MPPVKSIKREVLSRLLGPEELQEIKNIFKEVAQDIAPFVSKQKKEGPLELPSKGEN